jgi:hypothetical protein
MPTAVKAFVRLDAARGVVNGGVGDRSVFGFLNSAV